MAQGEEEIIIIGGGGKPKLGVGGTSESDYSAARLMIDEAEEQGLPVTFETRKAKKDKAK